jgi:hypothetical protein
MTENVIKLKKSNSLKLGIQDENGKDTGEYLEFFLDDIELPLRYQELLEKDKKNKENLRNQLLIIDKREDVKGKKLMSKNEEDKIRALNNFFMKEVEVYNMFLGARGVEKLLNGRKFTWTTLQEIDEIIEKQITPYVDVKMEDITKQVKEKYSQAIKRNKEKIEVIE